MSLKCFFFHFQDDYYDYYDNYDYYDSYYDYGSNEGKIKKHLIIFTSYLKFLYTNKIVYTDQVIDLYIYLS